MINRKLEETAARPPVSNARRTRRPRVSHPAIRTALLGSVLFFGAVAATPSYADSKDARVLWVSPNAIAVESDGTQYTKLANLGQGLSAEVAVEIEAGLSGYVKSWSTWLAVATKKMYDAPGSNWVQFSGHKKGGTLPVGSLAKILVADPDLTIPPTTLQGFAVAQCNVMADDLRSKGKSDEEIFGQDRVLEVATNAFVEAKISGIKGTPDPQEIAGTFNAFKRFDLICQEKPYEGPTRTPQAGVSDEGPTRTKPLVKQATLLIQETATITGACVLNLNGVIETSKPYEEVKFRYVDAYGKKSSVKTVETDHSKIVMFHHKYNLAGTGFKNGSVRIDIQGEDTFSPWSQYEVTCRKNAPNHFAGNDGGNAGPKPVNDKEAAPSGDPTDPGGQQIAKLGKIKAKLGQPDLMATPLGMSLAGGKQPWGSTLVIDNPAHAAEIGVGSKGNLCRFSPARFRPFNKGTEASGPFKVAVRRGGKLVHQAAFELDPQSGLPGNSGWHEFDLDLKQGKNVIKVVLDKDKAVAESDEKNNVYTLTVKVNFPCFEPGLKTPSAGTKKPGKKFGNKFGKKLKMAQ